MLPIIIIGGPTASGKSALAVNVAKEINAVIINSDSMQLYREIPIITAQPRPEDQQNVPHKLYGVLPASINCSVAYWLELATQAINEAHAAGQVPIVVGGTGMYMRALMQGLSAIPDIEPAIRAQARALHHEIGGEAFHQKLSEIDPIMAARLPIGDTQRMIRAYEVMVQTGKSLADWQAEPPQRFYPEEYFVSFVVNPPRQQLYDNCNARFLHMLEAGAIEEVKRLDSLQLDPTLPAMKALGVPELRSYIHREISLEEATTLAQTSTRHYAKRQVTWFRHQIEGVYMLEKLEVGKVLFHIR